MTWDDIIFVLFVWLANRSIWGERWAGCAVVHQKDENVPDEIMGDAEQSGSESQICGVLEEIIERQGYTGKMTFVWKKLENKIM